MERNMWDEIFAADHYVYGQNPNLFLQENVRLLKPGNVLCVAEGEGRNAVFLAKQGFNVTAIDASQVGLKKAEALAAEHGVSINTIHAKLQDYDFGVGRWDSVVSIFCHLPPEIRADIHQRLSRSLCIDGVLLLEAYSQDQHDYKTGGPTKKEMLYSSGILREDFQTLQLSSLEQRERVVIEGTLHTGKASVMQLIALRKLFDEE